MEQSILGEMTLTYFFRQCLALSIRLILFNVFEDKIYGPLRFATDFLAVIGTVFGIATTQARCSLN